MKRLILIISTVILVSGCQNISIEEIEALIESNRNGIKWEYKIETPSDILFEKKMNIYGNVGWELVSARRASGALGMSYECIFKRRKQ